MISQDSPNNSEAKRDPNKRPKSDTNKMHMHRNTSLLFFLTSSLCADVTVETFHCIQGVSEVYFCAFELVRFCACVNVLMIRLQARSMPQCLHS